MCASRERLDEWQQRALSRWTPALWGFRVGVAVLGGVVQRGLHLPKSHSQRGWEPGTAALAATRHRPHVSMSSGVCVRSSRAPPPLGESQEAVLTQALRGRLGPRAWFCTTHAVGKPGRGGAGRAGRRCIRVCLCASVTEHPPGARPRSGWPRRAVQKEHSRPLVKKKIIENCEMATREPRTRHGPWTTQVPGPDANL